MAAVGLILRELRGRGRWPSTYVWRTAYAALLGAALLIAVASSGRYGPDQAADVGISIFVTFVLTQLAFAGLWALVSGAGSVAREKTSGTLGLLLISGMRPAGIVLTKFVAVFSLLLLLLAGGAPLLVVTVGLGGVELAQVGRVLLLSLSLVYLLLNLGLFCSAVRRSEEQALAAAFFLALCWLVLLPVVLVMAEEILHFRSFGPGASAPSILIQTFMLISPLFPYLELFEVPLPWGGSTWLPHVVFNFAAGSGLAAAAALLLPRFIYPSPKVSAWSRLARSLRRSGAPRLPSLLRPRLRWLGRHPVYWRESLVVLGTRALRAMKPLVVLLILLMWILIMALDHYWSWRDAWEMLANTGMYLGGTIATLLLLVAGARAFTCEQTDGVGGLLLGTQLTPGGIVLAKLAGILRGLFFFLALPLICYFWATYLDRDLDSDAKVLGLPVMLLCIIAFVLVLAATCSLYTRKPTLAFAAALGSGIVWAFLMVWLDEPLREWLYRSRHYEYEYYTWHRREAMRYLCFAGLHLVVALALVSRMVKVLPRRLAAT